MAMAISNRPMITLNKRLKIRFPYFELYINIPGFRVTTQIMQESMATLCFNYILFQIDLFKWVYKFRVYKPINSHVQGNYFLGLVDEFAYRCGQYDIKSDEFVEEVNKFRDDLESLVKHKGK